jgi:hypothetical protein
MDLNKQHLAIVILNWKGWTDTIECLESVYKSEYKNYHIILVIIFLMTIQLRELKGGHWGTMKRSLKPNFLISSFR